MLGLGLVAQLSAAGETPFDAAAAFGARPSVSHMSLSPDGSSIAFLAAGKGSASVLFTLSLEKGAKERAALSTDGKPERLRSCVWVSNSRLVCTLYGVIPDQSRLNLLAFTRLLAVDADGGNMKYLSNRSNEYTRGYELGGGRVIDLLPDQDGTVLMARVYRPDDHVGTRLASDKKGLGVDRIDTRTLAAINVEPPREDADEYISDGRGTVRIMGLVLHGNARGQESGIITYMYRMPASREWLRLGDYNFEDDTGFRPVAVDPELDLAYGLKRINGRVAAYSIALDGSLRENLVYSRPDVDVADLVRIGRRHKTLGAEYATDRNVVFYFDADIAKMHAALGKALPAEPNLTVADSSVDGSKLLVFAASDKDPGTYYLFDRKARELRILMAAREQLVDAPLASVKPIEYRTADGTAVPAYLTVSPGEENPKNRPAIVLPHGGPSARDQWQFDWLTQYFASRGFVVLQPNFRGSNGYGDAWLRDNGFRSWRVAIGDVLDAGRWLTAQGIADPAKLAVVGWSYGGYAALQSAVMDPTLFKAVIAIAPVTDLNALKEQHRYWSDHEVVSRFVGSGANALEGSPVENAAKIKVPVLLFHGALDRNVGISQSKAMASRISSAGGHCELVTWDGLDHQLEDSDARTQMLRKSDEFLHQVLGLEPAISSAAR